MTELAIEDKLARTSNYTWRLIFSAPLMYWRSRQGFMVMLALLRLASIAAIVLRFLTQESINSLMYFWPSFPYLIFAIALSLVVYFHPAYAHIDKPMFYAGVILIDTLAINGFLYLSGYRESEIYLFLLLPLIMTSHYLRRRARVLLSTAVIASYLITLFLMENIYTIDSLISSNISWLWFWRSLFLCSATWIFRLHANFPHIHEKRIISPQKARARLEQMLQNFKDSVPYDTISVQILYHTRLQIVACNGFRNPNEIYQIEFPANDKRYPNYLVMKTRKWQILDANNFPSFKEPRYHADHIQTWLGVPLISPTTGEHFGLLSVDSARKHSYHWWDAILATWFARKVSAFLVEAALGPAALTQATKREDLLNTLKAWAELFRPKITADWEDDLQAADELVRFGERIFHVEDCSIYFLRHKFNEEGEKTRVLHLVASSAIPPEIFVMNESQVTSHHGDGLTGLSVNRNRTVNYGADQIECSPYRSNFTAHLPYLFSKYSRQILIVPLRDSRGKAIGAIKLENRLGWPSEDPFFPVEQNIFEVFAAMVSLMLENIRLRNFANRQSQGIHNLRSIIHRYALSPLDELIEQRDGNHISEAELNTLNSVRNTVSYTKIGLDSMLAETAEDLLLEKEGLIPAIHEFVESLKPMMHLNDATERITFDVQEVREDIPFRVRVGFYNIARESILNMVRHSGIGEMKDGYCRLSFYKSDKTYHLLIEDNGIGFSPEPMLAQSHSFGLRDMYFQRDVIRRHCSEADIQVDSSPEMGTRIHIWAKM